MSLSLKQVEQAVRAATFLPKLRSDSAARLPSRLFGYIRIETSGCWAWTGKINNMGYGEFVAGRAHFLAHRFVYRILVGEIGSGLTLDHLCRNTRCVRPEHLEPVTMRENTLRGTSPIARQAVATHCKRGHPFEGANLYRRPDGDRDCVTCRRMHQQQWYARRRSA